MMRASIGKQNLVWGILLIIFGVTAFIETFADITVWGWVIILFAAGLFTLGVSWRERTIWANFIPTYVLWSIAGMVTLIELNIISDEGIAVYVLWIIALPFVVGYYRIKNAWGLLIPAYVLFTVGIMVGLIGLGWLTDFLIPAYVLVAISIPFFVVYVRNPKNWCALIPGGIMGLTAIGFLLATPAIRLVVPLVMVLVGIWILTRQILKR
jgi:hypothetical protein